MHRAAVCASVLLVYRCAHSCARFTLLLPVYSSRCTYIMPVSALEKDKPKILFYGAMMAIQNYGFYQMYYSIFPHISVTAECTGLRFWVGFFALDCFVESFCCLWMAMGGYVSDPFWFAFGWILHLLVALPYCISTVGIPMAMYSADGTTCRASMGPAGIALEPVYWLHAALFLVYVWMMLSITYYSFAKATFFSKQVSVTENTVSLA